eukprot:scaffold2779_cov149-Skeletonema_menzelii.AAC.8
MQVNEELNMISFEGSHVGREELDPPPRANVDDRRNIHGAILKGLLLNKLTCGSPSISVIDHTPFDFRGVVC